VYAGFIPSTRAKCS